MDSHTTVIIRFDNCVIFVSLLYWAEFSHRLSEVAQTLDAISGIQFLAGSRGSASDGFLARSESGVAPGYAGRGWEALCGFCFGVFWDMGHIPLFLSTRPERDLRHDCSSPRQIQHRLGKNGSAVSNWTVLTTDAGKHYCSDRLYPDLLRSI